VATVTADANGVWTFDGSSLANGYHNIKAAETNSYGNSASASVAFQLWKTQNSINEMIQYMAGQGANGVYTVAPDIIGWTSPNTAVQIYDGANAIGAATSNASGYYSYQTANLTDGFHIIGVSATNLYGSTAHASLQFTFV
jgi:large repetitive protein